MEIKPIAATEVSSFISNQPPTAGLFLQTPGWLKFQNTVGRQGEHLGIYVDNELVGVATAIIHTKYGKWRYVYLPRGPVVKVGYLGKTLEAFKDYYKQRGFIWLRVEPPFRLNESQSVPAGFIKAADVQPSNTSWLDLTLSENDLLNQMHAKTRYNIRLSEKKELTWNLVDVKGMDDFWSLMQETAQRDKIIAFAKSYYKSLLDLYGNRPLTNRPELAVRIAQVKYRERVLAMSLLLFSGEMVTYLHGASSNEQRALMPTYLLHWRTVQEAKQLGYKIYDWRGVAVAGDKQKAWQGITRFKLGWGGEIIDYMGAYDWVYKRWRYRIYKIVGKIRKIL
ncbi:MAG: peptidoglycan bridge formation glycyltransferase FemA/FemB family protein [Patescibacteria group bacterium]